MILSHYPTIAGHSSDFVMEVLHIRFSVNTTISLLIDDENDQQYYSNQVREVAKFTNATKSTNC